MATARHSRSGLLSESESAVPSRLQAVCWHAAAWLVAALPALASALSAHIILDYFDAMSRYQNSRGHGGVAAAAFGLYRADRPLLLVTLAAAVLSGLAALVLVRKPGLSPAFPGVAFVVGAIAAGWAPAALLWSAESVVLDVFSGRGGSAISAASMNLESLLSGARAAGIAAACLMTVAAAVSWRRLRRGPPPVSSARAIAWASASASLLAMAALFALRSSVLLDAARTGRL